MKTFILASLLICGISASVSSQSIEIQSIIDELKTALASAKTEIGNQPGALSLKSADITLQTVATIEGGAKIKLWIISLGKTYTRETMQKITITLIPSKDNTKLTAARSLAEQLKNLIVEASKGISTANSGEMPLNAKSMVLEVNFVVKNTDTAGLKFEIVPVTADLSGTLANNTTHQIRVAFEN